MRTCTKCGVSKELDCFEVYQVSKGWRRHECRECVAARKHNWSEISKDRIREYRSTWYKDNREKAVAAATEWNRRNRRDHAKHSLAHYYRVQNAAIMAYGGYVCACCGETEPMFLSLDHMNNDGKQHRLKIGSLGGAKFYKALRDEGWPAGFQVLCMNCNQGRHRNGGICPHKEGATTIPKGSRAQRLEAPDGLPLFVKCIEHSDDMVSSAQECAAVTNKVAD